jgi:hypothetical protein
MRIWIGHPITPLLAPALGDTVVTSTSGEPFRLSVHPDEHVCVEQ